MTASVRVEGALVVATVQELISETFRAERWATLAWFDTKLRYRRTILGPFWITLSTGAMILAIGILFGTIFGNDITTYMPYFAAGVIVWTFISGSLLEGCTVFIFAGGMIKSVSAPISLHVYRVLARHLILLAHNFLILILLWLVFQWPIGFSAFLAVPGLVLVTIAMFGANLALGILCARFRDIPQIVGALLQFLFLLTPVIWEPHTVRGAQIGYLVDLNPLHYFVQVVRGPLLGSPPDALFWMKAAAWAFISAAAGLFLYDRFRHRVAFWV